MIRTIRSNPRCMEHHGTLDTRRDLHLGWKRTAHGTSNNNPFTCASRNTHGKTTKPLALALKTSANFAGGCLRLKTSCMMTSLKPGTEFIGWRGRRWWKLGFHPGIAENPPLRKSFPLVAGSGFKRFCMKFVQCHCCALLSHDFPEGRLLDLV